MERIIKIFEKEIQKHQDQITQYENNLKKSNAKLVNTDGLGKYFFKNGELVENDEYREEYYKIVMEKEKIEILSGIFNYLKNLNIIEGSNPGSHGVCCDGMNLYIDQNKFSQYSLTQQDIIKFFYSILPLFDIHSIGSKGYNNKAGQYQLASIYLTARHIGLSNEKKRYGLSTRIKQGEQIEGLKLELPPLEWKYISLGNLINSNNPFFEYKVLQVLPNNPNKTMIEVKQKYLRINEGSEIHTEKVTFISFMENNNKILTTKDKDVKDFILSQKIMDKLIS